MSSKSPPDPGVVAGQQAAYNKSAAQTQNALNSYNQNTPFGSLAYAQDPNSPSGYDVNVNLSPAQQALLNQFQSTQGQLGGTAGQLASNFSGLYGQPADLSLATGQTGQQLLGMQQKYWNPIFQQQQSNLNAQLQNQGLNVNDAAYQNAQNLLARNQGDVTNQFLMNMEPQAFSQAIQQYQLPLQTFGSLFGATAPQMPAFQQTPTAQVQPPNYAGLAEQNYGQQQAGQSAMMQGLFGIPTALAGGWPRSGLPMGFGAGAAGAAGAGGGGSDALALALAGALV